MKGKHRWQILLKSPSPARLSKTLSVFRRYVDESRFRGVQVIIDVDPISTM